MIVILPMYVFYPELIVVNDFGLEFAAFRKSYPGSSKLTLPVLNHTMMK
jgi:hypothetical protein